MSATATAIQPSRLALFIFNTRSSNKILQLKTQEAHRIATSYSEAE